MVVLSMENCAIIKQNLNNLLAFNNNHIPDGVYPNNAPGIHDDVLVTINHKQYNVIIKSVITTLYLISSPIFFSSENVLSILF